MMPTLQKILIADLTNLPRFGIRGPQAEVFLRAQKIALPSAPNTWKTNQNSYIVMRLGKSEFLIEGQRNNSITVLLNKTAQTKKIGIHPVPRADAAFLLMGNAAPELLSEICMLDMSQDTDLNALYMTQVAGISVTLLKQSLDGKTVFRLWCDGTYHRYMHETLTTIAKEIGELELSSI